MNVATVDDVRWKHTMDRPADLAAAAILKAGGVDALSLSLQLLSNVPPDKPWPQGLQAFVDATTTPADVDWAKVTRAQEWFSTWGVLGTAALFCASLPETYCLPGIARLLGISGQLEDHVTRRIKMTGQMLFDVMTPKGFAEGGRALRSLRRTRLMHASLRTMLLDSYDRVRDQKGTTPGQARLLWTDMYGLPINQLELAYTLLTFSYIVLRSLIRLGVTPDPDIADDYIYTWNIAGRILGLDPELLPATAAEAEQMFERIKATNARAIDDTPPLMAALETCWAQQFAERHVPLAVPMMHSLFHELLSAETRQLLSIAELPHPEETLSEVLMPAVQEITHVLDRVYRTLPPIAHLAARVNDLFALKDADTVDGGLYDTTKHMRAWFDQVPSVIQSS